MPEFSNERITVEDVSKMTGIPVSSIRAGIVYGWFPVGVAIQNDKPAKTFPVSGLHTLYLLEKSTR